MNLPITQPFNGTCTHAVLEITLVSVILIFVKILLPSGFFFCQRLHKIALQFFLKDGHFSTLYKTLVRRWYTLLASCLAKLQGCRACFPNRIWPKSTRTIFGYLVYDLHPCKKFSHFLEIQFYNFPNSLNFDEIQVFPEIQEVESYTTTTSRASCHT